MKVPKVIYLQVKDDLGNELDEWTWCVDKINETDIEYHIANTRLRNTNEAELGQPCPHCDEGFVEIQLGEYEKCKHCAGSGQV